MDELRGLGIESLTKHQVRLGAGQNQFGVKLGDLRRIGKSIGTNPELANALWDTGNLDAMLLATLLFRPKLVSPDQLEAMVNQVNTSQLADWLLTHVIKLHPEKETLRQKWMTSDGIMTSRAAWSLTTERIIKRPAGLDLGALLTRIEQEMASAHEMVQWTMNYCLAEIGINFPEHRQRAIAIGETLGVFRDYPTSKGCTSPYAPIWIAEMVGRQP